MSSGKGEMNTGSLLPLWMVTELNFPPVMLERCDGCTSRDRVGESFVSTSTNMSFNLSNCSLLSWRTYFNRHYIRNLTKHYRKWFLRTFLWLLNNIQICSSILLNNWKNYEHLWKGNTIFFINDVTNSILEFVFHINQVIKSVILPW